MGNVGADDAPDGHLGVKQQQNRHADGARSKRRGCDEYAHDHAQENREEMGLATFKCVKPTAIPLANFPAEDEKGRGDYQHRPKRVGDDMLGSGALQIEL
jgi:hypothetical protein